jgi:speckle-type POZ protein
MNNNDSTSEGEYCIPETEITSSRCITESFTATLDFEVTDDAQLKGMRVGEFVASRVFIVRGYKWSIRFCPNGQCYCAECAGHASAFLGCGSQAKPVIAKYALSLLGKHDRALVEIWPFAPVGEPVLKGSPRGRLWGARRGTYRC